MDVDFLNQVQKTISRYQMLNKGDKVVVACSGGPDSVALLYLLNELKEKLSLKLFVAHFNHRLRGKEADLDEIFVRKLASFLKLKIFVKSIQIKNEAKKRKLSIEECARVLRYGFLNQIADKVGAQRIALGHNSDDQAETVLMRLIRGSGSLGLSGIPPIKERIIRPLIEIRREKIEEFLTEKKIGYRIDSSNLRPDFLRNKVRLSLLPLIRKEYNPKIEEVLNRTAKILSAQEKHLKEEGLKCYRKVCLKEAEGKIILDLRGFFNYDMSLKRIIIRLGLEKLKGDLTQFGFEPIESVLRIVEEKKSGKRVDLSKRSVSKRKESIFADITKDYLTLYKEREKRYSFLISKFGKKNLNSLSLKINLDKLSDFPLAKIRENKDQNVAYLDGDKLKFPLRLRSREVGDRFKPLGFKGTKKVADFLVDLRIPRCERRKVLLLISNNRIAWIAGFRISDEFKVTPKTKKVVKIEMLV
jgi:tRNA(Ile)-lysidine synthase